MPASPFDIRPDVSLPYLDLHCRDWTVQVQGSRGFDNSPVVDDTGRVEGPKK